MKAQVLSIRELFAFLIGIFILSGTYYLFNESLKPKIIDFSIREDMKHLATHIKYIISSIISTSESIPGEYNITQSIDLPLMYGDYNYRIFFENNSICASPTEYINFFSVCSEFDFNITDLYRGAYVSGTNLLVNVYKLNNKTIIEISNA